MPEADELLDEELLDEDEPPVEAEGVAVPVIAAAGVPVAETVPVAEGVAVELAVDDDEELDELLDALAFTAFQGTRRSPVPDTFSEASGLIAM